jgi:hypothetical protein
MTATTGARPRGRQAFVPATIPRRLGVDDLALLLRAAPGSRKAPLTHVPLSWDGGCWPFEHPLDYLALTEAAASAPGRDQRRPRWRCGRLGSHAVSVCGDGDFLMGATPCGPPFITEPGAHRREQQLVLQRQVHQERVARMWDRPVENKWIGQRIDDPTSTWRALPARRRRRMGTGVDATTLPRRSARRLRVEAGSVAVVDVRIVPAPAQTAAPAHGTSRG